MNKKTAVSTLIAVATLTFLVIGATYAYFTMGPSNSFGTKELNATIDGMGGSVVLSQENDLLSLNITGSQMSEENVWNGYYASGSYIPANIAKVSVAGDGIFKCDYTITVTKSSTSPENDIYNAYFNNSAREEGEIVFNLNYNEYDFFDADIFPLTYSDTMYNISKDTPRYITSNLIIINQEFEQNYLKGKDMTLTYSINDFECELSEPSQQYTDLTFTYEYLNDIGYAEIFADSEFYVSSESVVIPETFQGKDGVWYRVTGLESIVETTLWNVESLELPNSLKSISSGALANNLGVETLKLPKQLVSIGTEALGWSEHLRNLYIPKSVQEIGIEIVLETPLENIYFEGSEAEWNALFADYVGSGKEYSTIFECLGVTSNPTIHYNVKY